MVRGQILHRRLHLRHERFVVEAFDAEVTPGPKSATLTITSDDPDQPTRLVMLIGDVLMPFCAADFNHDGDVNFFDYLDFADAYSANDPSADFNHDGEINFFDYLDFVDAYSAGC